MENKIQENLKRLDELKKKSSGLKAYIKDQLLNDPEYHKITEEIEILNAKRKKIIAQVNADNKNDIDEIERLKVEMNKEKQIISDLALSDLIKGENAKITDSQGMILAPVISVKYKKTGDFEKPSNQ